MAHEFASAAQLGFGWVSICFRAGQRDNFVGERVFVAKVVTEGGLFVAPFVPPFRAIGIFFVGYTVLPCIEHLGCAIAGLGDDESRVEVDVAALVAVKVAVGVEGHGEHGLLGDVPVIKEPFEREVVIVENGIGVHENDVVVCFEGFADHGDFNPGLVSVGVAGGLDEFVVVAVYHCWSPLCQWDLLPQGRRGLTI